VCRYAYHVAQPVVGQLHVSPLILFTCSSCCTSQCAAVPLCAVLHCRARTPCMHSMSDLLLPNLNIDAVTQNVSLSILLCSLLWCWQLQRSALSNTEAAVARARFMLRACFAFAAAAASAVAATLGAWVGRTLPAWCPTWCFVLCWRLQWPVLLVPALLLPWGPQAGGHAQAVCSIRCTVCLGDGGPHALAQTGMCCVWVGVLCRHHPGPFYSGGGT
jgi:hypothetical protein